MNASSILDHEPRTREAIMRAYHPSMPATQRRRIHSIHRLPSRAETEFQAQLRADRQASIVFNVLVVLAAAIPVAAVVYAVHFAQQLIAAPH